VAVASRPPGNSGATLCANGRRQRVLRARAATSSSLVPVPECPVRPRCVLERSTSLVVARRERSFAAVARGPSRERSQSLDHLDRPTALPLLSDRRSPLRVPECAPDHSARYGRRFSSTSPLRSSRPAAIRIVAHGANSVASMAGPHYSNAASRAVNRIDGEDKCG